MGVTQTHEKCAMKMKVERKRKRRPHKIFLMTGRTLSQITGRLSRPTTTNYHSHLEIFKISLWLIHTKIKQYKCILYSK